MEVESMRNLQLSEICRVCLNAGKKEMRPLFGDMIADMLSDCAQIQVEKIEGWPDKVCLQCMNQISRFHSFKKKVEKMDYTLRKYIKGLTVIVEEQVPAEITFKNIELPTHHHHHLAPGQPSFLTTTNGQVLATAFGQPLQIQSNGQLIPVQMLPNGQAQLVQIQRPPDETFIQPHATHHLEQQQQQQLQIHHQQQPQIELNNYQQQQQYYEEEMILQKDDQEELGEEEEIVDHYIIEEIDEEELEAIAEKDHEQETLHEDYDEEVPQEQQEMEPEEPEEEEQVVEDSDDDIEIVIEPESVPRESSKHRMISRKCNNHVPIPISIAETTGDPEDKEFMAEFISLQTSCPAPGRHVCNLCHKEYKVMHSLHNHMKSHSNWIKANCKRQPECIICHKKFKGPGMLKMHMKTHEERALECQYCKKSFQTEYHLGLHLVKHKRMAESFKCDPCGQSFISSNDLRLHKRRCHNKFTQPISPQGTRYKEGQQTGTKMQLKSTLKSS